MRMRLAALSAWSGLAVLVAHDMAYRFVHVDSHARAHALEASGHAWYAVLAPGLAMLLLTAFFSTFLASRVSSRRVSDSLASRLLFVASAASFLGIELIERIVHIGSLSGAAHNIFSLAGVAPFLVGLALLSLLVPAFRVAARFVERLAAGRQSLAPALLPPEPRRVSLVPYVTVHSPSSPRAPPRLSTQRCFLRVV